jgi:hypothetical protein
MRVEKRRPMRGAEFKPESLSAETSSSLRVLCVLGVSAVSSFRGDSPQTPSTQSAESFLESFEMQFPVRENKKRLRLT